MTCHELSIREELESYYSEEYFVEDGLEIISLMIKRAGVVEIASYMSEMSASHYALRTIKKLLLTYCQKPNFSETIDRIIVLHHRWMFIDFLRKAELEIEENLQALGTKAKPKVLAKKIFFDSLEAQLENLEYNELIDYVDISSLLLHSSAILSIEALLTLVKDLSKENVPCLTHLKKYKHFPSFQSRTWLYPTIAKLEIEVTEEGRLFDKLDNQYITFQ